MLIDPNVKKLIIFNGGGGIVERDIKLSLNQGMNKFELANVPASFDPNSADIQLEYINPNDKDVISLQQTIVSLPDRNTSSQIIEREKSAAQSIISYSIDITRELREKVSTICEASSYRTFADMKGVFDFIINAKNESEVTIKVIYFIADLRIKWQTTLQVDISDDGTSADIEGFLVVDNTTGFSYENVELGFAVFELPSTEMDIQNDYDEAEEAMPMAQQAMRSLNKQKKTQRMRNLML